MNNNRNLIIFLLIIVLAILGYLFVYERAERETTTENDGSNIVAEPPSPSPSGSNAASDFPGTAWLVQKLTVDGKEVSLSANVPAPLTLNFETEGNKFSGFAGCNSLSGSFTSAGAFKMSFSPIATTKMFCAESSALETSLLQAMEMTDNYTIFPGGMSLRSADGKTVIEYREAI